MYLWCLCSRMVTVPKKCLHISWVLFPDISLTIAPPSVLMLIHIQQGLILTMRKYYTYCVDSSLHISISYCCVCTRLRICLQYIMRLCMPHYFHHTMYMYISNCCLLLWSNAAIKCYRHYSALRQLKHLRV